MRRFPGKREQLKHYLFLASPNKARIEDDVDDIVAAREKIALHRDII